jgi:hypothetical protein
MFDFCLKIKVVKIVFWPYHCVEEEETKPLVKTTSKSDVGNGRTRRHAPAGWLATRTDARHASHASSSPGWADPTRPTCQTRIRMTSSWCKHDASMHSWHAMSASSHLTRQHSGTHLPRHQTRAEPRRAELSWAELCWSQAEPSREPRDKILCSGVYVQPDLRLNLGRSSGQNCFDQNVAAWNAIWTISDLFPANLIVPDAMVRSNHWDLRPKMMVVN